MPDGKKQDKPTKKTNLSADLALFSAKKEI
jgi:hypothetical protein